MAEMIFSNYLFYEQHGFIQLSVLHHLPRATRGFKPHKTQKCYNHFYHQQLRFYFYTNTIKYCTTVEI